MPRILRADIHMLGGTGQYFCNLIAIRAIMTLGCVLKQADSGVIAYLSKAGYSNKNIDPI